MTETDPQSQISRRLQIVRTPTALAALLILLCASYTVAAFCVWPSLYPDPSYGFLVRKSVAAGAPWNHMTEPRPGNMAEDHSYFYAVWSPGQYMVPGTIADLGMTLGAALRITCILFSLLGLAGWLLLYRRMGFDWTPALLSVLLITATRSVNLSFLVYTGSDLLAFAFFPYIAVVVLITRNSYVSALICVPVMIAAFFLKNSLTIYNPLWIAGVLGANLAVRGFSRRVFAILGLNLLGVVASMLLIYYFYVSRSWTPVSYKPSLSANLSQYLLPCVMTLLAATSLDDLLSRIFLYPGGSVYNYKESVPFLLAALVGMAFWLRFVYHKNPNREMLLRVALFVGGVTVVFVVLLSTHSAVSLQESRHYRLPGYALMPFLVQSLLSSKRVVVRVSLALLLTLPGAYGVFSFASNWNRAYEHRHSRSADLNVAYLSLTPRDVAFLRRLDAALPGGNNLVVTPTPSYALEFSRARTLATSAVSDTAENIESSAHSGVVDNLVVIVEVPGMAEPKVRTWLASFRSYNSSRWGFVALDGLRIYLPDGQVVNKSWLASLIEESK